MPVSRRAFFPLAAAGVAAAARAADPVPPRKLVMIAGTPSHGPGDHEFNAGVRLLAKCLAGVPGLDVAVHLNGYPKDGAALDGADAVFVYADGGPGHPLVRDRHLDRMAELMAKGVGLMCGHYAVEVPKDLGGPEFGRWLGGYYEHGYSCNPFWTPRFDKFPDHPITRGVGPFGVRDEWYMHMRFPAGGPPVVPILAAVPPDSVRDGPYVYPKGPYPHIQADKGKGVPETMMWATERGGRRPGRRLYRRARPPELAGRELPQGGAQRPGVDQQGGGAGGWRGVGRDGRGRAAGAGPEGEEVAGGGSPPRPATDGRCGPPLARPPDRP